MKGSSVNVRGLYPVHVALSSRYQNTRSKGVYVASEVTIADDLIQHYRIPLFDHASEAAISALTGVHYTDNAYVYMDIRLW